MDSTRRSTAASAIAQERDVEEISKARIIVAVHDLALLVDATYDNWNRITVGKAGEKYSVMIEGPTTSIEDR